jgi:hypothetical protein
MNVAVVADYAVVLDPPLVKVQNGATTISGTLHRQPGTSSDLTGRVDIDFIGADGEVINQDPVTALFNPRRIPMDPAANSTYSIVYGFVAPPGSTVRVRYVDPVTAQREDVEGADYGANAGRAGGGGRVGGGGLDRSHVGRGGTGVGGIRSW